MSEFDPEQIAKNMANPLHMLPPEWRPHVWAFWANWSFMLKDQIALCVRVVKWKSLGMSLPDLRTIFGKVDAPAVARTIKFPAELFAALEEAVSPPPEELEDVEIRRREWHMKLAREEKEKRRLEIEEEDRVAAAEGRTIPDKRTLFWNTPKES